jgi:methyltransferase (TIGR00027 family)
MEQASRTALGAAMHRAAHQLLDVPPVFADPLALRIIGPEAERALRTGEDARFARAGLRAFVAARSRFAEDGLAEAHARGLRQYVLLGAGLDTFAYRSGLPGLAVFEVDHPATQAWKRTRLTEAGIAIPGSVVYAAVDFDREPVAVALARAGFDAARPACFAWLGVTPYLTREAVLETLGFVAGLGSGSEIVFDYAERPAGGESALGRAHQALAARVAAVGEPFRSEFEPAALDAEVRRLGFSGVEDLGAEALNARYFQGRSDGLRLLGRGRLLRARL